ncbi:helix-turn-helix domain-containing protein [Streptomyces sp. NPDC059783]|uniref:helix-turn-helix domain-containing protein n=1 Tax=Streptomyces sp. NPDC059783 TaxID=3346944 RepID=UPI00364FF263
MASRALQPGPAGAHAAAAVVQLREARGWDQRELAARLTRSGRPASQPVVSRMESGARRIDVDDLAALADVLGVSVAALLPTSSAVPPTTTPAARPGTTEPGPVEAALADDIDALGDLRGMEPTHAAVAYRLARQMDGHHPIACEECGSPVQIPNDARLLPQLAKELRATVAALVEGRAMDDDDDDDGLGDIGGF